MQIDAATLRRLWPHAPQTLVDAVAARSAAVFAKHGLTSELRVAHFLAQISHESGGGTITEESLTYTHAERIAAVWPTRFTAESAQAYVRNPTKLACAVYDGRMGNGPSPSTDGYNYRGRGLLQITGRDSYREIGSLCGLPLEAKPELAYAPTTTLEVAAAEFEKLGCLPFCDADNLNAVTRRVNGGYTGLAERKAWLAKWKVVDFASANSSESPESPPQLKPAPEAAPGLRPTVADPQAPATQAAPPPPPAPSLPRGSDEVLPPGVDAPGKTMASSKTGWAAVIGIATTAASTLGQAVEQLKPLLADPHTIALVFIIAAGAGAFVWFDRHKRLQADHV
jgi:putative chitinase